MLDSVVMKLFDHIPTRLAPRRDFPEYAFIPGQQIHPNKVGGHSYGKEEPKCVLINEELPEVNEDFAFALDLYHAGYLWESHVYLEALWNAHERRGNVADFMKALIKYAAAGVKFQLGQEGAARGHLERALELIDLLPKNFLGFDLERISLETREIVEQREIQLPIFSPGWASKISR